ncbi:MAG TPA: PUR family DNA/RNA-binding protein [Bacteroidetes bacterium]|nr:PUR family DNA/RNA-binding protein [Bacteroidota bacterium]
MEEERVKEDVFIESEEKNQSEEIFTKVVRAGKRTYFFDVKTTRKDDNYLTITESKKRIGKDGKFFYEKHKIFLYKEDFDKFSEGLRSAISFVEARINTAPEFPENKNHITDPVSDKISSDEFTDIDFDDLS